MTLKGCILHFEIIAEKHVFQYLFCIDTPPPMCIILKYKPLQLILLEPLLLLLKPMTGVEAEASTVKYTSDMAFLASLTVTMMLELYPVQSL